MAIRKLPSKKEAIRISSLALTPSAEAALKRISRDATDVVGRTVSESAVVRALLRYIEQQPVPWRRTHLYPHIEAEMNAGVLWGKRKS
jgi:hypothetical protein